jgi:hypothetical protein
LEFSSGIVMDTRLVRGPHDGNAGRAPGTAARDQGCGLENCLEGSHAR